MCTSTLSLTSAVDGVGGQRHASAALPPGKRPPVPLYRRLGGPQDRSGKVRKILPHRELYTDYVKPTPLIILHCVIIQNTTN